ncbi:hypothetical protein JoomaDRAFT_2342 [Galbibacter orientalis DSM 19592]|uniref:Uncharacterized protein n=1 Tax=Galbibacter orientalis DSM 19592 TaxID=926559 RepID=I3C6T4_9FLAO|nr:hypothetical protein [Galbibacter orientalis]EIJ39327.1 hypothetical protein JoomaDRAFT_2342 [Galbibacter orientalis DSM 19592]
MDSMFEDFKTDLDSLNPLVRKKALEIAKQLVLKKNYTEKEAITKAIIKAEEWFYDLEG